jgi:hypothetical protein
MSAVIRREWDLAAMAVAFGGLSTLAASYTGTAGLFPLVFLLGGLLAVTTELLMKFAPESYRERFERLNTGLASEMSGLVEEEDESPEEDAESASTLSLRVPRWPPLLTVIIVLATTSTVAALFGFIVAVPLLAIVVSMIVGSGGRRATLLTTVVLVVAVQVLFGELLNVPTLEGWLIDWTELI